MQGKKFRTDVTRGTAFVNIDLPPYDKGAKASAGAAGVKGYGSTVGAGSGNKPPAPAANGHNNQRMLLGSYTNGTGGAYNNSFNTSLATSLGSSPLFSPFSDDSDYNGGGKSDRKEFNSMFNGRRNGGGDKYDGEDDGSDINSVLWLICIGMSMTFLIFTIVTCFVLLYEVKSQIPIN